MELARVQGLGLPVWNAGLRDVGAVALMGSVPLRGSWLRQRLFYWFEILSDVECDRG